MRLRPRRNAIAVVRDTGWVGFNEFLTLITGLAVLNVLIIGLGPAGYGRYAAVQALASTLATLSCSWVVMVLFQQAVQSKRDIRDAFASSFGMSTLSATTALIVGSGLGVLLMPEVPLRVIALLVGAELLAGVLVATSTAAVQLELGMPTAVRLRILMTLTRFVVVVALGITGNARLEALALWLFVGYLLTGVGVFLWSARRLGLRLLPGRPRKRDFRDGFPHAGVLASLAVQEDSDKILMVRYADPVDAGLYAASYRLVSLGLIPLRALVGATHPRFLVDTPGVRREHLRRALRFTGPALAYSALAVAGILLVAPIVPTLLGADYDGTPPILMLLAPIVLLRGLTLFPMNALLGLSRYRLRFLTILGCSVLNVALSLALIPAYSYRGAIIATLITEVVFVIVSWTSLLWAQRASDRRAVVEDERAPSAEVTAQP